MKIADANVFLSSSETLRVEARTERLRMWVGRDPSVQAISQASAARVDQALAEAPAPAQAENKDDGRGETSNSGFDRNLRELLVLLLTLDPTADLDKVLRNAEDIRNAYSAQPLDPAHANAATPASPSGGKLALVA